MDILGHMLTTFCSVCRQFFGFIPASAHILQISSTMSIQFFPGHPGFLLYLLSSHCIAWGGIVESSILNTCPSHLSLLLLTMSSNFHNPVFFLISSFLTLSIHVIPDSLRWNFWWAASSFLGRDSIYSYRLYYRPSVRPFVWPSHGCIWYKNGWN